jgi:hypothetical protein
MRVTCIDAVGREGSDISDEDFCPPYKMAARSFAIKGEGDLPTEFALSQNYPNPFNPATRISFSLPEAADVKLEVFNVLGQNVAVPIDGFLEAGEHSVVWDASEFSSGVYLYRLVSGNHAETRKMLLLK